jgi:hypothetical protein
MFEGVFSVVISSAWGRSNNLSANNISVLSSIARIFPVFVAMIIALCICFYFYVFGSYLFKCIKNLSMFKKEMFGSGHVFVVSGLNMSSGCSLNIL